MNAAIFYPVGIGKHIVCIDADLSVAAIQTACRGEPRTPKKTSLGKKIQRIEHRWCELSAVIYRPQKERVQLKPTIKQK